MVRLDAAVKEYRSYDEQVDLLVRRGMDVGNRNEAIALLHRVSYYRLSGYWYPFRRLVDGARQDAFYPQTRLSDVAALYEFDARLRTATFAELSRIELAVRSLLGHELGRVDPCVHLKPDRLGPTARHSGAYADWLAGYTFELKRSREDFVEHHRRKYGGRLPVWVAVELLDWGGLARLYGFAPRVAQDAVADACGLNGRQLTSWLRALNLVRNTCAHHGRLFNRVHTNVPRLPPVGRHPDLDSTTTQWERTFGQLTLVQFLLDRLELGRRSLLPAVLKCFPTVRAVPLSHLGAAPTWQTDSGLWKP